MSKTKVIFVLVCVLGFYQFWRQREIPHDAGILVTSDPQQTQPSSSHPIKYKDVVLDPLADFSLTARVLSTERYWMDSMASIVPVDVAFGWGPMSDSKSLEALNMWQEGRFYFYSWKGTPPVDKREMALKSANMHLIPSSYELEKKIKGLRKGHLVSLKGNLVRINFADGREMKSSLTREDSGAGACEIIWVKELAILGEP